MPYDNFPAGFTYQLKNSGQFTTGADTRTGNSQTFAVETTGTQLAQFLNVSPDSTVFVTSADPAVDPRAGAVIVSSGFGPPITGVQTGYQTNSAISIQLDPNQSLQGTLVISSSVVNPGQQFTLVNDSPTTFQNLQPVCFAQGTLILTARGEIAVEDLAVGDFAVMHSGECRSIRWIGHQTVKARHHRKPAEVMPVRIAAGALGENRPLRDLVVSPGHAICLDVMGEVLIPAIALVNGTSIRQEQVESVTYWHIELDSHDILMAEGQPAESYLDMGNRSFFAEGVVSLGGSPDGDMASRTRDNFCRPYHADGKIVEAVRVRIDARAELLRKQAVAIAA